MKNSPTALRQRRPLLLNLVFDAADRGLGLRIDHGDATAFRVIHPEVSHHLYFVLALLSTAVPIAITDVTGVRMLTTRLPHDDAFDVDAVAYQLRELQLTVHDQPDTGTKPAITSPIKTTLPTGPRAISIDPASPEYSKI